MLMTTEVERNDTKKGGSIRAILIACLCALILLEAAGFLYLTYFGPINMKSYVSVDVLGVDDKGNAQVEVNQESLLKDASRRMWFRKTLPSSDSDAEKAAKEILSAISVRVNPEDHLKVGDSYTITVHPNNRVLNKYKLSVLSNSFTDTVKKLEKYDEFDAFADVNVSLSGNNGNGIISLSTPKANELGLVYEADKTESLSNGDVVKVTVKPKDYTNFGKYAEKYGRVPASYQKEFEVSDLGEYVTDVTDITTSALFNQMFDKVKSDYAAGTKKDWTDPTRYLGATYVGSYLLTGKTGTESPQNYYYLVYKVTVRDAYTDVYRYARFENISKNADGTLSADINNYSSPSGSKVGDTLTGDAITIDTNNHYLVGFNSEYSLYDKYIEPYETKYTVSED